MAALWNCLPVVGAKALRGRQYHHPNMPFFVSCGLWYVIPRGFATLLVDFALTMTGAVRLEHQFYALGQACANACDIALEAAIPLQQVPYQQLRERMLQQGMILDVSKVGAPEFPDH